MKRLFFVLSIACLLGCGCQPQSSQNDQNRPDDSEQLPVRSPNHLTLSPPMEIRVVLPSRSDDSSHASGFFDLLEEWKLFENMPEDRYPEVVERFRALKQTLETFWTRRAGLYQKLPDGNDHRVNMELYAQTAPRQKIRANFLHASRAFQSLPDAIPPQDSQGYWNDSVDELLYLLDAQIVFYADNSEKMNDELKRLAATSTPEIERLRQEFGYHFSHAHGRLGNNRQLFPLNETQQKRLLDGENRFRNMLLDPYETQNRRKYGATRQSLIDSNRAWMNDTQDVEATAFLVEYRDKKLARWKVMRTPDLDALEISADELLRWDGSTSLRPLADLIVAHLSGAKPIIRTGSFPSNRFDLLAPESQTKRSEHPLVVKWSDHHFNQTHGSIMNVIDGQRDLAFATRMPSEDERKVAETKNVELICTPFARDALVFINHRNNPVRNLTTEQIRDIFSRKATQWSEVGGRTGLIETLVRNRNSGSEELMRELVMQGREMPKEIMGDIIMAMIGPFSRLEQNPNGIGYSVFYYEHYMVVNAFARAIAVNGVQPSTKSITSGEYPLVYDCVLVQAKRKEKTNDKSDALVRWLVSDEGQRVVRESGYVPLSEAR